MKLLIELLIELLAIRLSEQNTLAKSLVISAIKHLEEVLVPVSANSARGLCAKSLVIAIRLGYQKAKHSHSAKSPKNGDISRWLTIAKYTRKGYAVVVPKSGNLLSSKLDAELTPRWILRSPDKSGSYITSLRVLLGLQPLSVNSTRSLLRSGLPDFVATSCAPTTVFPPNGLSGIKKTEPVLCRD